MPPLSFSRFYGSSFPLTAFLLYFPGMGVSFNIPQLTEADGIPHRAAYKINTAFGTLVGSYGLLVPEQTPSATVVSNELDLLRSKIESLENEISELKIRVSELSN